MAPKIHDISPLLQPGIAVWPGDCPFTRTVQLRMEEGASVNLSSICLSLHTGAHADAPRHHDSRLDPIDRVPLERYIGRARLVTVQAGDQIQAAHLTPILAQSPERLLIRCNPGLDAGRFPVSFVHFSSEAAEAVGRAGVQLVGIDAPSVDRVDSQDLPVHHLFGRYRVAVLENLCLDGVPDGEYELIALPLRIKDGDGSPVRAVLREL